MTNHQSLGSPERGDPQWGADVPLEPDALSSGGGLASYGHALRRRWPVALLLGLVCGGIAAASCWLWLPRTYTATAIIRIASSEMPLVFETADLAGQRQFDVYKRTQRQLVTNRNVLAKALNSDISELPLLQTQADPVTWLASQLKVSFPDDAEMMHVQLSADRPSGLAEVVNAVVTTYLDDVVGRERLQRLARFSTLEKLHAEKNLQLRKKYNDLRQFTDAMGGDPAEPLSLEQQNALQQLGTIRSGLSDLTVELRQKEAELKLLQESAQDEPLPLSDLQIEQALASDTVGAQLMLRRDSVTRGMQQTSERLVARKAEPLLEEFKRELDSIERELEARRKSLRDELSEARKAALRQQNAGLEKQLQVRISVLQLRTAPAQRSPSGWRPSRVESAEPRARKQHSPLLPALDSCLWTLDALLSIFDSHRKLSASSRRPSSTPISPAFSTGTSSRRTSCSIPRGRAVRSPSRQC